VYGTEHEIAREEKKITVCTVNATAIGDWISLSFGGCV